ncbi:MAG: glycosyl hydrolase family 8 [Pseudomonadota bacterium]
MNQHKRIFLRGSAATLIALFGFAGHAAADVRAPDNLAVVYDASANSAAISFTAKPSSAWGYVVERRPAGTQQWSAVSQLDGHTRSYFDQGLAPLTRYEYRVRSLRVHGPSKGEYLSATVTTPLNFPYAVGYGRGIVPTNYSQAQKNVDVDTMYKYWRASYMTTAGAGPNGMRVYKPEERGETVSEGMGYGMLISVYMANETNTGKADFDALLTYYKSKEKFIGSVGEGLMAWRINSDGTVNDPWVAPDGDLDAAYSLLVADKKWGSDGAYNYKAEAVKILNGLQTYVVHNRGANPSYLIGGSDKPNLTSPENAATMTMSSYAMVGYMKQFKAVSDAARAVKWDNTLRASYKMFDYFFDKNPTALTPYTFLTQNGPNQYLKPSKGYNFGADACRVPWRIGIDYLWHGNANAAHVNQSIPGVSPTLAQEMPARQAAWLNTRLGGTATATGNPQTVMYSYELNGTQTPGTFRWGQRNMIGSMAVGAMTDARNQEWLNRMYDWMRVQVPGMDYANGGITIKPTYFGDTVMMVTMIAATGNMPNLPGVPVPAH